MERLVRKLESSPDTGEENDTLKDKVEEIQERFKNLTDKTSERKERITKAATFSKKYVDDSDVMKVFLDDTDGELTKLDAMSCDESDVVERISRAKV